MVPPVMTPSSTSSAPRHSRAVIDPKTSVMRIAVIRARIRMRCLAMSKVCSTAPAKRSPSRDCWPKAWTIFVADSTSVTIEPTSATRSWLVRLTLRSREPKMAIGMITTGIPITR